MTVDRRLRLNTHSARRRSVTSTFRRLLVAGVFCALAGITGAAEFELDVTQLRELSPRPGSVINAQNFERYAHLLDADFGKLDRKSTRLNSSHDQISYAVFCLKKKKKDQR